MSLFSEWCDLSACKSKQQHLQYEKKTIITSCAHINQSNATSISIHVHVNYLLLV